MSRSEIRYASSTGGIAIAYQVVGDSPVGDRPVATLRAGRAIDAVDSSRNAVYALAADRAMRLTCGTRAGSVSRERGHTMERLARFEAVTGIVFAALLAASIVVSGNTPPSDATGAGVALYFKDNKNSQNSSAFFGVLAIIFFVFFGAILWNRLRRRLAESPLPAAGLVGVALIAVGAAIFSSLTFALTDVPDKINPSAVQALNVLNNDLFFPFAIGIAIFLIANGLAIAHGGVLPRWLGWIGIVIGLTAPTPLGFVGFFGSGAWVLVASVMMLVGDLRSAPTPTAAAST